MNVFYTTTEAIRAVLGLTAKELYDSQITDLGVAEMLQLELGGVYPDYASLKVKIDNSTATPEEEHTWKILSQYVKYEAAAFLLPQFQMLVVQKISDGDVEMARFQNNNLQDTINRILTMRDKYKNMLLSDAGLLPVSVGLGLFSTVQPSYDPVTNEGTF